MAGVSRPVPFFTAFAALALCVRWDPASGKDAAPPSGARERWAAHWAFRPLCRPSPPDVRQSGWAQNPIDRFILLALEAAGISPACEADRQTLIRRVTLDLIGLLPDPEEVADFLEDTRPDAYERVVDRLLGSPHYGEKWARPWLDLCHYADSDGYLTDQLRPVAWRYRQWLVDALNRDMRFDHFTIEQLAGDLLEGATAEDLLATGFLRNTLSNREGGADLEEFRVEQVVDRAEMVGTAWLGLTVGCARCHDHKHDPISQREFYELYAFFDTADEVNIDAPLAGELERTLAKRPEHHRKRAELIRPVEKDLLELEAQWERKLLEAAGGPGKDHVWDRQWEVLGLIWGGGLGEGQLEGTQIVLLDPAKRTGDQKERLFDYFLKRGDVIDPGKFKELKLADLSAKLEDLKKDLPVITRAPAMRETQTPRQTFVQIRGDFRSRGQRVEPGVPAFLPPLPRSPKRDRLALARWLVSPENPLTPRVAVNRAWQELFGRGLVPASGDFGTQGAPPSHPELLDWLAVEFMRPSTPPQREGGMGWSLKALHRLIVTSATYRQSSKARPELAARDAQNALLGRQETLRLSAESIRDVSLAASGLLDRRIGGPSVYPPQPESVAMEGFENKWTASEGGNRYRRGLYTFLQRLSPFAQNVTFDAPPMSRSCSRRERSNTPLQALTLLNDEVFFEAAKALAARLLREARAGDQRGGDPTGQRLEHAFQVCLARSPTPEEKERLAAYLEEQVKILRDAPAAAGALRPGGLEGVDPLEGGAWTCLSSVLLNLHEFITRE